MGTFKQTPLNESFFEAEQMKLAKQHLCRFLGASNWRLRKSCCRRFFRAHFISHSQLVDITKQWRQLQLISFDLFYRYRITDYNIHWLQIKFPILALQVSHIYVQPSNVVIGSGSYYIAKEHIDFSSSTCFINFWSTVCATSLISLG